MLEICFILVEPQVPQNVGAAARAIKTMGFRDLRVVNSRIHQAEQARWLAHGSSDILDSASLYNDLASAISDCDLSIATTSRLRNRRKDYLTPDKLLEIIKNKGNSISKIGIVFGREEFGLTNKETDICDLLSTVPMHAKYPSLNLGQTVMIYTYTLSKLNLSEINLDKPLKNEESQQIKLMKNIKGLLPKLGIQTNQPLYKRLIDRFALLGRVDIKLGHKIIRKINEKLDSN